MNEYKVVVEGVNFIIPNNKKKIVGFFSTFSIVCGEVQGIKTKLIPLIIKALKENNIEVITHGFLPSDLIIDGIYLAKDGSSVMGGFTFYPMTLFSRLVSRIKVYRAKKQGLLLKIRGMHVEF